MLGKQDRVVLDTLLPTQRHEALRGGIFDVGFDAFYDDFQQRANRTWRLGFRTSLWAAAWVAPLLIRRIPPLSRHDQAARERALAAMGSSRVHVLRQLSFVLKNVAAFCYGADPSVRAVIGLPRLDRPEADTL